MTISNGTHAMSDAKSSFEAYRAPRGAETDMRIMIVEDEPSISMVLAYNLEAAGYVVERIERGDEAEIRIAEEPPDLLILADGDHGYGNPMNVQRTVRAYGRAGAAAVLIEDKITPRALTAAGKPCLPRAEARMKIRAAVEAAKESGILVLARTDCRPTQGIDEAVARVMLSLR